MANAPALGMDGVDVEAMMAEYGSLYSFPWEQWYTESQSVLPGTSDGITPGLNLYTRDAHQQNNYTLNYPAPEDHKWPVSAPNHDYPAPISVSEPISPTDSSTKSPAQREKRKRKRSTNERAPAKTSRRDSSKNNNSQPTAKDTRHVSNPRGAQQAAVTSAPSLGQEPDGRTKRVQERNRIASNKFRVKKRENAKKLREDEQDIERINQDLSSCVADLTTEVYQLKMRLLQHTDCDCALIQSYIANEAHRYIRDLDEEKRHEAHYQA
ncbi:hypothetical protein NM208_g16583 [Fusarium decemcellulare]|uniref:Uncharacterized protein n=1 Tax=Fusarium decemcellulare TaxID=57161 RepID=A0ACC1RBH7_9HYPO|nr:hypothetical protein NM208_g16583 [Fusarium decemcellulare]